MTRPTRAAAAALLMIAATAALLFLMGRPPICTCGAVDLWVNQANSSRTSQMLADEALEGVNAFMAKRKPDWSPK